MSSYYSDLTCPACNTPMLLADDRSAQFGHANPMVYCCSQCGAEWRWTDAGPLQLVEVQCAV